MKSPMLKSVVFVAVLILAGSFVTLANPSTDYLVHDDAHAMYQVTLISDSNAPQAGQPLTLMLDITTSESKAPVTEFDEVHTKLLHLIVISEDLQQFLHLHPDYQGEGRFVLKEVVLPEAGNYVVYADFTPTGAGQQVVRSTLSTADATVSRPQLASGERELVTGPLRVRLDLPDSLSPATTQTIAFHVSDAESGEPIDSLDEYLGAAGHLVIIDESSQQYIHTHPAGDHDMRAMAGMTMQYGPDLSFEAEFPESGLWAAWLQIQYKGEVYTAPFVIEVSGEAVPQAEATHEAHSHG
jgi:hypothetical protein